MLYFKEGAKSCIPYVSTNPALLRLIGSYIMSRLLPYFHCFLSGTSSLHASPHIHPCIHITWFSIYSGYTAVWGHSKFDVACIRMQQIATRCSRKGGLENVRTILNDVHPSQSHWTQTECTRKKSVFPSPWHCVTSYCARQQSSQRHQIIDCLTKSHSTISCCCRWNPDCISLQYDASLCAC